jgi:hypothetical protein
VSGISILVEILDLLRMGVTTDVEDFFFELVTLFSKYELSWKKMLRL